MTNLMMALQDITLPAEPSLKLPADPMIFLFLLFLTFVLHMVAMNFTLGGSMLQMVNSFTKNENLDKYSKFLSFFLPISMSFTVTLGIAPLLFIQVLYGQIFYATTVFMGWLWLGALIILMLAYYGLYFYQMKHQDNEFARKWTPLITFVLLLAISLVFIMNFKLFYMADQWQDIYQKSIPGLFMNLSHVQVWPSFFHYLLGAVAVSGLLMVIHGWIKKKEDEVYSNWAARTGGLLFLIPTLLQFAVGTWLLLTLPKELIKDFMFGNQYATVLFFGAFGCILLALLMALWTTLKKKFGFPVVAALLLTFLIIAFMTLIRAFVRDRLLGYFDVYKLEVNPQWDTMIIFGVLLVAGLAIVGWMIFKAAAGDKATASA